MSREKFIILGIAVAFYLVGGWSMYGEYSRHERQAAGQWRDADEMILAAYARDAARHQIVRPKISEHIRSDPAAAIIVGDPDYSVGLGLIGFGTLLALLREIIQRRRGKYRGEVALLDIRDFLRLKR